MPEIGSERADRELHAAFLIGHIRLTAETLAFVTRFKDVLAASDPSALRCFLMPPNTADQLRSATQ